jgi:hypothetical protein
MLEWNPQTDRECYLVERMVLSSWRMDRGVAAEEALLLQHRNAIIEGEAQRQSEAVAALVARLDEDPDVIREVRRIPAGARWAREQYQILERHLEANPCLLSSQRHLSILLLGKRISDVFRGDLLVTRWLVALLGAGFGPGEKEDRQIISFLQDHRIPQMSDVELGTRINIVLNMLPERTEAKALLQAYIAQAIAALDEQIETLDELATRDLEFALQYARLDATPDGQNLQKCEKGHEGSFFAAMRGIDKLQNPPRPRAPRGARKTESPGAAQAGAEVEAGAPAPEVREESTEDPQAAAPAEPTATGGAEADQQPPRPDIGADTSKATSSTEAPVVTSPSPSSTPAADAREKTSDDIPVFEMTEEEIERDFPDWAAARKLERTLSRYSAAGNRRGDPGSSKPPPPNPGAVTGEAIFGRPPPSGPAPGARGRPPPKGQGPPAQEASE